MSQVINGFTVPAIDDVVVALMAERMTLGGNTVHVWLVVHPEAGWKITRDRKELEGVYARMALGTGDSNGSLLIAATNMIERITRWLEAHTDGEAFGAW